MKYLYLNTLYLFCYFVAQGAEPEHLKVDLARFNIQLSPLIWNFSGLVLGTYQTKYPEDRYPISASLIKKWRADDDGKKALDNWAFYAFGKGKSGEFCSSLSADEFSELLPIDGKKIKSLMKKGEGGNIIMMRYATVSYELGKKHYLKGRVMYSRSQPAMAASLARVAAGYAQQEVELAAGKERMCMLDRQIYRETACRKCLRLQGAK